MTVPMLTLLVLLTAFAAEVSPYCSEHATAARRSLEEQRSALVAQKLRGGRCGGELVLRTQFRSDYA
jgi:hypothetical protein